MQYNHTLVMGFTYIYFYFGHCPIKGITKDIKINIEEHVYMVTA